MKKGMQRKNMELKEEEREREREREREKYQCSYSEHLYETYKFAKYCIGGVYLL